MPLFPSGTAKPASIVDAFKAVLGNPTKVRANFAQGRCVHGAYIPSEEAKEVTRSRSFTGPSRVLARFSIGGGNPEMRDTGMPALRGFSFRLGDDEHRSDILAQNAPVHFARTLDQMLAFLKARIPGPDGRTDLATIEAFSAANPETLHQARYIAALPRNDTLAGTTYWGVHSFPATNSAGETRFIKFKIAPVGGNAILRKKGAGAKATSSLRGDLEDWIAAGDGRFSLLALLDRPGDPTADVTIRWPDEDSREEVRLGTIVITGIEPDATCDTGFFDPANLAEGVGHPPDEIFAARCAAYAIAFAKRRRSGRSG